MINSYGNCNVDTRTEQFRHGVSLLHMAFTTGMGAGVFHDHIIRHYAWKLHFMECDTPGKGCEHESPGDENLGAAGDFINMIVEAVKEVADETGADFIMHEMMN